MEVIKTILLFIAIIFLTLIGLAGFIILFSALSDYDLAIIGFDYKKVGEGIVLILLSSFLIMKTYQKIY